MRIPALKRNFSAIYAVALGLTITGCQQKSPAPAAAAGMQAMPVKTVSVTLAPVAQSSEYVATIMSRRSATMQPQVNGRLTQIHVRSGDHVQAGQLMMEIDAQPQLATVEAQRATEQQKKALFDYNALQIERQRKLFADGIISRDVMDQAEQSYANTKADYESAVSLRKTQEEQLAYYSVRAPFDGVIGDVPVHVGDYVSTTTILLPLIKIRTWKPIYTFRRSVPAKPAKGLASNYTIPGASCSKKRLWISSRRRLIARCRGFL